MVFNMEKMQTGDNIRFGDYEWQVLDICDNKALLITKYIIGERSYHDTYEAITWADSSMRSYLNEEFLQQFQVIEQSRILPVLNKNPDNPWYGTDGGDDTED